MISGGVHSLSSDLYAATNTFKNEVISANTGNIVSSDSVQNLAPSQTKADEALPIESSQPVNSDPAETSVVDNSYDTAKQAAVTYSQAQLERSNVETFTDAVSSSDSEDEDADEDADEVFDTIQSSQRKDTVSTLFSASDGFDTTGQNLSIVI